MTVDFDPRELHKLPVAPRKGMPLWPLFMILGLFAVVLIGLMVGKGGEPEWAKKPADWPKDVEDNSTKRPESPPVPLDPNKLGTGWVCEISAETPIVDVMGDDVTAAGVATLPAGAHIAISSGKMFEGAKWYYVSAKDTAGARPRLGWIPASALKGQKLKRLS